MLDSQELVWSLEIISCHVLEIKNNVQEINHCYQVQQCAMLGRRSTIQPTYNTLFCFSLIYTPLPIQPLSPTIYWKSNSSPSAASDSIGSCAALDCVAFRLG
jgi:hypothetical protein